jgi:hypothetical protein
LDGIKDQVMSALPIREKIAAELESLSDEQAIAVLEFIHSVKDDTIDTSAGDDEPDPLVGFISGPTDMAERTEDILKAEFGLPKSEDNRRK